MLSSSFPVFPSFILTFRLPPNLLIFCFGFFYSSFLLLFLYYFRPFSTFAPVAIFTVLQFFSSFLSLFSSISFPSSLLSLILLFHFLCHFFLAVFFLTSLPPYFFFSFHLFPPYFPLPFFSFPPFLHSKVFLSSFIQSFPLSIFPNLAKFSLSNFDIFFLLQIFFLRGSRK